MSKSDEIREIIRSQNLSIDPRLKIEGPWAFRGLDGHRAPIYIFLPNGEKKEIGEAVAKIDPGLKFEINLNEDHDGLEWVAFEVPMRFAVKVVRDKNVGRLDEDVELTHEEQVKLAKDLKDAGYSNASIAHIMRLDKAILRILLKEDQ